jgi:hypothetical protein
MSIKFNSELVFDIYVKKHLIEGIDFSIKSDIEKYLKKLFKTLNNKYNIAVEGFYNITVYIDKYYGIILHLEKEELDYYEYYKNQVDMRLVTVHTDFMYEVDDIPFDIIEKVKISNKNKNIYLTLKEKLTDLEMMKLLENSKIIYI